MIDNVGAQVTLNAGKSPFLYNSWKTSETSEEVKSPDVVQPKDSSGNGVRRAKAAQIMSLGIVPNCTQEQVMKALAINGDNMEQTLSWVFENPFEFSEFAESTRSNVCVTDGASTPSNRHRSGPGSARTHRDFGMSVASSEYDDRYLSGTFMEQSFHPPPSDQLATEAREVQARSGVQRTILGPLIVFQRFLMVILL